MVDEIALPAFGLVGHAFLMDLLVLRRQRRLLRRAKPLGWIELDALASEGRVDRIPLTFPVGVFRPIGRLCVADRCGQCDDEREHSSSACTNH
jgi:hypothetical protein